MFQSGSNEDLCLMDKGTHMKVAVLLLAFLSLSVIAEERSISGRAILWAYDSRFWKYETDDSIHPGVIECVDASQNEIRGYCSSLAFVT